MQENTKGLKVFYNNINGYTSKEYSFLKVIETEAPDIIALCAVEKD